MKNNKYLSPVMEVLAVSLEDVITTSAFTAGIGEVGIDAIAKGLFE